MNKDALLATVIGFGVGLIIAGLVFVGPTIAKNLPSLPQISWHIDLSKFLPKRSATVPTPGPKNASATFSIESPLADAIEGKNESLVSGNAVAGAVVVIEGESDDAVVTANQDGAYAGKVSLGEGKNDIKVTEYVNGKQETLTVTVYFTPESF
jgi:hypothetical protein